MYPVGLSSYDYKKTSQLQRNKAGYPSRLPHMIKPVEIHMGVISCITQFIQNWVMQSYYRSEQKSLRDLAAVNFFFILHKACLLPKREDHSS